MLVRRAIPKTPQKFSHHAMNSNDSTVSVFEISKFNCTYVEIVKITSIVIYLYMYIQDRNDNDMGAFRYVAIHTN